ncbi:MAG TPA: ATP-binding protein [Gammaproteobacteria bacterium]
MPVEPTENPSPRTGPFPGWTLRAKGAGMLLLITVYAVCVALYATAQKNRLLDRFNELQQQHESEAAIRETELGAFQDITEFLLFIEGDPVTSRESLRAHIEDLQRRQLALMQRFPEVASTFAELSHSLARAYSSPSPQTLAGVRHELAATQRHLQELARASAQRQAQLAEEYYRLGERAAFNALLLGLAGMLAISTLALIFFAGLTRDIKRLERRVDDVIHGYRGAPLAVSRGDELGQLTADVNRMVSELAQREHDLDIERRKGFQQEKMASIGTLAAGIVHEIGNPIAAISGLVYALRGHAGNAPAELAAHSEKLDLIETQVDRLSAIARDVSDFAAPQPGRRELLDLNGLVRNTHRFMRFDQRLREMQVQLDLDSGLPAIYGVADQLTQLLMNLMINAADATDRNKQEPPRIRLATARAGHRVRLQVEDNGHGMDAATREKALDPFFTTKGAGKGTGLGLPLCYTLASEHGGTLELESSPGVGTCVTVTLPIDERGETRPAPAAGRRAR